MDQFVEDIGMSGIYFDFNSYELREDIFLIVKQPIEIFEMTFDKPHPIGIGPTFEKLEQINSIIKYNSVYGEQFTSPPIQ